MEGPAIDSSSTLFPKWVNEEGSPEWKLEVAEDNVRMFKSLHEKYPSGFFIDENDLRSHSTQRLPSKRMLNFYDIPSLVDFRLSSETPFGEGGLAELFHGHSIDMVDGERYDVFVMKVLKEGTPLRDVLKLFPTTVLANDGSYIEDRFEDDFCITL